MNYNLLQKIIFAATSSVEHPQLRRLIEADILLCYLQESKLETKTMQDRVKVLQKEVKEFKEENKLKNII